MPQKREIAWAFSVETLVMLGQVPHIGDGQNPTDRDRAAVAEAFDVMGLTIFVARPAAELSGGEQAQVLIARVMALDTPLILADERIAGLDPGHQIATMEAVAALAAKGKGVVMSLHDPGLAARHCSRLVLMHEGRIWADDVPEPVLTPDNLADVFGISAYLASGAEGVVFQALEVLR